MHKNFFIASLLAPSPTTQESPEPSTSNANNQVAHTRTTRPVNTSHRPSMLPSLSSAAAAAAAATTTVIPPSTASANHSSTTPTAHLLSSDGVQTHPIDLSTHSSSQSVIATPTSSINPVTPPTQLHASLVSCAECIILYSAFLSWCGCLPTATLPNPLNASTSIGVVNPTNAAVHPPTGTVTENTANGGSNANNENRNGVGPCTRSDEVGDGEAEVREEGGDEWRCEKCGKTYNSSTSLRKHKQSHLLRWKCHFCEKTFSRNWLLEGHERTHTGEKPFVCPTCQRAFADRSNMRAHMQTHLTVKRHRCPHCAQSFTRRSQLIRHMQTCLFSTAAAAVATAAATTATVTNPTSNTPSDNASHHVDAINPAT